MSTMLLMPSRTLLTRTYPRMMRAASTRSKKGLVNIIQKNADDIVITFAKRTAVGRARKGQWKDTPVDQLLYSLFKATLEKTRLDPAKLQDICVATCYTPSPLYVSRAAALAAGVPYTVPISTLNRLCSSGLMAVREIAHAINSGEISLGWAVAAESMSLNPRPTPEVGDNVSKHQHAQDSVQAMGWTSENVAEKFNVSREKQDYYALLSNTRASDAARRGIFADEILPIEINGTIVSVDDTIRSGVTSEGLAALKSAFPQWQPATTTAGNASGVGDGAGLVMMTTRERAEKEGMEIVGKWVGSTLVGVEPRYMGISPIYAVPKILEEFGMEKEDVDVYEINEAFASQFGYCVEQLGIPIEKINPNGGSIAITHPVGMTGIRQIVTGLAELKRRNEKILCTSMCIGSGMGAAGIFVNESVH